jgi:hypothetical protein
MRGITTEGIEAALNYATQNKLVDKNDYLGGYHALLVLFRDKLNFEHPIDVEIAAYAVYGWMPTILKRVDASKLEGLRFFAETWKGSFDHARALGALRSGGIDLQSINNSVVGTSKFLHFVAPESSLSGIAGSQLFSNSSTHIKSTTRKLTWSIVRRSTDAWPNPSVGRRRSTLPRIYRTCED